MLIPESLWIPSHKDVVAQFAPARVSFHQTLVQNLATIEESSLLVPNDQVVVVTHLLTLALRGGVAVSNVVSCRVETIKGQAVVCRPYRHRFSDAGLAAAPTELSYTWSGQLVLLPGDEIVHTAEFSAADPANSLTLSMLGVQMPRGNWHLD